jgi:hypothetical protein
VPRGGEFPECALRSSAFPLPREGHGFTAAVSRFDGARHGADTLRVGIRRLTARPERHSPHSGCRPGIESKSAKEFANA